MVPVGRTPKRMRSGRNTDARHRSARLLRGVNYFRRFATTISAGDGQQGVSPTTWRHSVIVVGRSVAVSDVSAEAPAGA
jgi:hypothetical protein